MLYSLNTPRKHPILLLRLCFLTSTQMGRDEYLPTKDRTSLIPVPSNSPTFSSPVHISTSHFINPFTTKTATAERPLKMSREHRKEHKSKRSRDPDEAHRSHKHKSLKSHKSHKASKSPKIHKSKPNISESHPLSAAREEAQIFNRIQQERILAALAPDPILSSPKPAKVRKFKTPIKAPKTVSIAGVFKRPNHQPPVKKERKVKKKIPDPDPQLSIELQGKNPSPIFTRLLLTIRRAIGNRFSYSPIRRHEIV